MVNLVFNSKDLKLCTIQIAVTSNMHGHERRRVLGPIYGAVLNFIRKKFKPLQITSDDVIVTHNAEEYFLYTLSPQSKNRAATDVFLNDGRHRSRTACFVAVGNGKVLINSILHGTTSMFSLADPLSLTNIAECVCRTLMPLTSVETSTGELFPRTGRAQAQWRKKIRKAIHYYRSHQNE